MKCDHIEELLPAYVEDDLSETERADVAAHMKDCPSCTEALGFYTQLETSLLARRELPPSPAPTFRRVALRVGIRRRHRVLRTLVSTPSLAAMGFVVFGLLLLIFGNPFAELASQVGALSWDGPTLTTHLTDALESLAFDEMVLYALYLAVFALILFTGSWMVLRFVRE